MSDEMGAIHQAAYMGHRAQGSAMGGQLCGMATLRIAPTEWPLSHIYTYLCMMLTHYQTLNILLNIQYHTI